MRGAFIVIEGIDGAGKDVQIEVLMERLRKENISCYITREPTSHPIGKLIRSEYLSNNMKVDSKVLSLLFATDRLDHITNPSYGIIKYLDKGLNVISNIYELSSFAYDGTFTDINFVLEVNKINMSLLKPDLTIYIDIKPDVAIKRIESRNDINNSSKEIYEDISKLNKIRNTYITMIEVLQKNGEKIVVVDGDDSIENVSKSIWKHIKSLKLKKGGILNENN
jgi:dTMP kinase